MVNKISKLIIRESNFQDAEKAAKLHVLEKDLSWQTLLPVFAGEFSICSDHPDLRTYFVAFEEDQLIGYGLAKKLTIKRIDWLFLRAKNIYIFLDDPKKPSLAMYYDLGFKDKSRGWTFTNPHRIANGNDGLLLEMTL